MCFRASARRRILAHMRSINRTTYLPTNENQEITKFSYWKKAETRNEAQVVIERTKDI